MVDNKTKISLIIHKQKNISLMKISNILLMLYTHIIMLSSFVIYFFLYVSFGNLLYITLNFHSMYIEIHIHMGSNCCLLGMPNVSSFIEMDDYLSGLCIQHQMSNWPHLLKFSASVNAEICHIWSQETEH